MKSVYRIFILLLAVGLAPGFAEARGKKALRIKLGTLAPDGSAWHLILKDMGQQWKQASDGRVRLVIHAGGTAGEEANMVRKMRLGTLHSAGLSVVGLASILPAVQALSIPQMYADYDELDYVLDKIGPDLEARLKKKGFIVLHWGDLGWIRFFSTEAAITPADMRKLKMYVSLDQATVDIWKDFGFQPRPLTFPDMLPLFQTGLIDAAPLTAIAALATQIFGVANHMLDVKWAPLVGATVIEVKAWNNIPADVRDELLKIARNTGNRMRDEIRRSDDQAIEAMRKRSVTIHSPDASTERAWHDVAVTAYPRIRTDFVGAELFDEVVTLRDSYRASKAGGAKH